ncbi:hypothetical protein PILCRDRAFT_629828 [Piloderma croceum F 1598]|uniref:Uncharacterized protein n=1 Tax=Piloderma croceum (strain F 1598) TaxID=765440 RepID=A0A0C3BHY4_PILCF|nr:hypothetical protein PILCRDRAFT_629828 [Piloderma croceum F 1598]
MAGSKSSGTKGPNGGEGGCSSSGCQTQRSEMLNLQELRRYNCEPVAKDQRVRSFGHCSSSAATDVLSCFSGLLAICLQSTCPMTRTLNLMAMLDIQCIWLTKGSDDMQSWGSMGSN